MITRLDRSSMEFDYDRAFHRNLGYVSAHDQERLRKAHVLIVGLGGTGSIQAEVLARLGIGHFTLADPDTYDLSNLNRQLGASTATVGRPKCTVIEERILSINPTATVRVFREGLTPENATRMLTGIDLVLDSLDFYSIKERLLLAKAARAQGVWVINTAPLGYGASVLVFAPHGLSFEDYFDITPEMPEARALFHFFLGLAPRVFLSRYFDPSSVGPGQLSCVSPAFFLAAGFAGTEASRLLLRRDGVRAAPWVFQVDLQLRKLAWVRVGGLLGKMGRRLRRAVARWSLRSRFGREPESFFQREP